MAPVAAPSAAVPPGRIVSAAREPSSDSPSPEEARRAFFRVAPPTEDAAPPAPAGAAKDAPDAAPAPAADAGAAAPAADDTALPVFQDPDTAADAATPGNEDTFTPPRWIDSVAPESREEALKFARGQYERTQKERQKASAALAERDAAKRESEGKDERIKELQTAPPAVDVPELVLSDIRTVQEVDAMVESAPAWLGNLARALDAIQKDGEFVWGDKTFTAEDVPAIVAERDYVAQRLQAAPKRRAYLETYATKKAEAAKAYPDLFKPESALAKAFDAKLKESPSLAAAPDHHTIIADHLMMKMVRSGKYRLVSADAPKAAPAKTNGAPDTMHASGATPTPRAPGESADAAAAADLRKRADEGDRDAQNQLRLRALRAA